MPRRPSEAPRSQSATKPCHDSARVLGLGLRVERLGFIGFRASGFGFRIYTNCTGFMYRVLGFGILPACCACFYLTFALYNLHLPVLEDLQFTGLLLRNLN